MFMRAIVAIVLSGAATVALVANADVKRPGSAPAASDAATVAETSVASASPAATDWGSPPLNPAASIKTALVDFAPVPAPERTVSAGSQAVAPVRGETRMGARPATYTAHPASATAIRVIPVRLGEGFSPEQRSQIIQAVTEWNRVLNGFGRLQIVGESTPETTAPGTWFVRQAKGAAPVASSHSLQTLAYTQPTGRGGTVLVYTEQLRSFDLARVMRHEFGHVLGLKHDPHGGVMAARYSEHDQRCIDRHTANALAAAWRLEARQLNWCE